MSFNKSHVQELMAEFQSNHVVMVAVCKGRTRAEINELVALGVTHIGENRLQEAQEKLMGLPSGITKHFIGHLQTNKAAGVVHLFDVIQSVDRLKLAQAIDRAAEQAGKVMPVLIQVNTSLEPQKRGVSPSELEALVRDMMVLSHLRIVGLMTLAVRSTDSVLVRQNFKKLRELFDLIKTKNPSLELKYCSMGMSGDYPLALSEGATMVRIGRGLFSD
ncbi:YggS family pyridoxal phosphate-dependent enzyme [Candidatus Peregrinibacteria bacterium]|nr:MAG: YggS family pyridoxal phosphate-dependent enzyme [Candidatus Peregrinibacteria bacterium]